MKAMVCGCSLWMNFASCWGSAFCNASKAAESLPMVLTSRSTRLRAASGPKALRSTLRAYSIPPRETYCRAMQISPEIIHKIAAVIGQKLQALGEFSRESYGGVRAVSEMFNRLDSGASKEILESIEKENGALADTIRHLMFVFEDMLLLETNSLKEVLAKVDRKVLTLALKGTSEPVRKHFVQCLSQRGAEMLLEDMEALGPVKIKEVEAAQQQIIGIVRQLESDGTINLKGAGGEQYVV